MQNIGFVEKSDADKLDMVKFLVDSAKGINVTKMTQEDNMTEEIINDAPAAEEVVEEVTADIAPEADAEVEAPAVIDDVEKAAKPEDEEEAAEGEMDATESSQDEEEEHKVSKSDEEAADAVTELKDAVTSAFSELTSVVKTLSEEIAELKKSVGHVEAKVSDAESDFSNLGKRIDAVEADTAFRKSGDLGEIVQEPAMVEKSVWGGRFLTTSELLK
jgi:chromosome segregation ATPase